MKIGIVGCGNVAKNHFTALENIKNCEITAVCDIKRERADEKAKEFNANPYYSFEEMLKNEEFDCIHIATPHYLHTQMAIKALKKGINVFLEKPCSVSLEEIQELEKAQKESEKQLGVCFQNRYNSGVVLAKDIIDSEKFGKVKGIRAFITWCRDADYYSDDWHGALDKECGGVLINQSIHTVDLIQYLGGECKSVSAHAFNDHLKGVIEVEDTVCVLMELENKVTALLYATTAHNENSDVIIDIKLEKATLRLEGDRLYKLEGNDEISLLSEKTKDTFVGESYWGHGHSAIIKDFYDCLDTGRKFKIDSKEGGKAAKIVCACYESNIKNQKVEV